MERRDRGYLQSFPSPQYGSEFLFLFLFLIFFAEAFYMRVIDIPPPPVSTLDYRHLPPFFLLPLLLRAQTAAAIILTV